MGNPQTAPRRSPPPPARANPPASHDSISDSPATFPHRLLKRIHLINPLAHDTNPPQTHPDKCPTPPAYTDRSPAPRKKAAQTASAACSACCPPPAAAKSHTPPSPAPPSHQTKADSADALSSPPTAAPHPAAIACPISSVITYFTPASRSTGPTIFKNSAGLLRKYALNSSSFPRFLSHPIHTPSLSFHRRGRCISKNDPPFPPPCLALLLNTSHCSLFTVSMKSEIIAVGSEMLSPTGRTRTPFTSLKNSMKSASRSPSRPSSATAREIWSMRSAPRSAASTSWSHGWAGTYRR